MQGKHSISRSYNSSQNKIFLSNTTFVIFEVIRQSCIMNIRICYLLFYGRNFKNLLIHLSLTATNRIIKLLQNTGRGYKTRYLTM